MATGEILFQRGMDEGEVDLWDDTALIKAYDQAVNMFKKAVKDPSVCSNSSVKPKENKHKSRKNRKNKVIDNNLHNWQVGNLCQAIYSGDGMAYDAIIASIDLAKKTCVVKYRGYGNEEEQRLTDLIMPLSNKGSCGSSHSAAESELQSEIDSAEDVNSHVSSEPRSRSASASACNGKFSNRKNGNNHKYKEETRMDQGAMPSARTFGIPGGVPPQSPTAFPFSLNGFPPLFPGAMSGASPCNLPPPPVFPMIPPPILPDLGMISDEKDALYGMLTSWFMSGYHTGFYQCLKQTQKTLQLDRETSGVPSSAKRQSENSSKKV